MKMTGRVVVIAGASRGIGAAAARAFVANGDKVVLLARSKKPLRALTDELGENALGFTCDVRDFAQVEQAILSGVETFGGCDVLVNNAGVVEPIGALDSIDPKAWGDQIDVNLKGVFNGIRAVLHLMLASGGGTVINVSSGAAHGPYKGWSGYCTSKAGVYMLTRQLHQEYGDQGIRALGLSPGTVATEMQRVIKSSGVGPVAQMEWDDHVPPEWPAKAMLWMTTPEADPWLGDDLRLRDPEILSKVGLA